MLHFSYSLHALEQMELRGITAEQVEAALNAPDRVVFEGNDQAVYQKVISLRDGNYLLRVFVNESTTPPLVKTVYRTSKISKYQ